MKKLPISHGEHFALVDDADYERVKNYNWFAITQGKKVYVACYGRKPEPKTMYLHRFLMNPAKGKVVDHKNGDPLDNRRSNLRICTKSQNQWNAVLRRSNKTGFKGVTRRPYGRFAVTIGYKGITYYLGSFRTAELAAKAYTKKALELYGEYARIP